MDLDTQRGANVCQDYGATGELVEPRFNYGFDPPYARIMHVSASIVRIEKTHKPEKRPTRY